jgi:hypothetical protein
LPYYHRAEQISLAEQIDARWLAIKKRGDDALCDEHEDFDDPQHPFHRNTEISDDQLCALLQPTNVVAGPCLLSDSTQSDADLALQRSAKWRYNAEFVGSLKHYLARISLQPGGATTFLELFLDYVGSTGTWPTHRGKGSKPIDSDVSVALSVFVSGITNMVPRWGVVQLAPVTRIRSHKLSAFGVPKQQLAIQFSLAFASPDFVNSSLKYMRTNTTGSMNLNFPIPMLMMPVPPLSYYDAFNTTGNLVRRKLGIVTSVKVHDADTKRTLLVVDHNAAALNDSTKHTLVITSPAMEDVTSIDDWPAMGRFVCTKCDSDWKFRYASTACSGLCGSCL